MSLAELGPTRRRTRRPLIVAGVTVVGTLVLAFVLGQALPSYFVYLGISVLIATISLMGLGVVTGTAGMIALCQLTFAAAGAYVVSELNLLDAPGGFIVWLLIAGLGAGAVGVVVGLPALRLRGVNLAVLTLGFAAAADITLTKIQFPGSIESLTVLRPLFVSNDRSYFFFVAIVTIALGLGIWLLQRSRWGSSWKFVAFSERGTAAAGTSVRTAKLTAFAVSAFVGGVSGGLLTAQIGQAYESSFGPVQSLGLYVLSIVAGSHLLDMALFGGILFIAIPEILRQLNIPQDWANVIFGVLGIQALTSGTSLGQAIRDGIGQRRRRTQAPVEADLEKATADDSPIPAGTGRVLLDVRNLTVQFGQVTALSDVSLTVEEGTIMGLIGPNGAGKSTFVDALGGFISGYGGTVTLDGGSLDGLPPHRRARRGLRRTFQQDRVPTSLTVGAYMRFISRGEASSAKIDDALLFFGCPTAGTPLGLVDVGTRRLMHRIVTQESARAVYGRLTGDRRGYRLPS